MKFAICNETFQKQPFHEVCDCAARYGYDGVEIAPFTLAESVVFITADQREEIRKTAANAGLEIVGLHWLLLTPDGLHLNCADKHARERTQAYYREMMLLCADLGGTIMVHGSPQQRNWEPHELYQDVFKRTVEFFQECMETAQSCNVTVCFEPLTHAETNFINSARDAIELIHAVNHPNFQLHLDVKAMCGGEFEMPDAVIRKYKDVMKHFHANDRNKRGPGTGDVDYKPIAEALKEVQYDGFISVEVFDYSPDPETIARESIQYLKSVFS
ncbi:MAG: sugar phosphate isomerase/epimerase [Candidatus Omnitrophota bacterium]|jgi:sugar phosphate isomerase/epimerase|nr:MAG: sugar phosphate isomerase/epimerase [Candidatus Omnitrophota bacterium]